MSSNFNQAGPHSKTCPCLMCSFPISLGPVPKHYENGGEDFLDRTIRTSTPDELRGAIKFTIGKYVDRLGQKDDEVSELTKIINYATRYKNHLISKGNES